jgi:outer membrane protein assembly factor BamB
MIITPDEMNPGNWTNPDPTLTAYDSSTGSMLWRIHTTPLDNFPGAFGGGMIFAPGGLVGTYQGSTLTAYDASSGAMKWTRGMLFAEGGACPTYMNGILFVKQVLENQATVNTVNLLALNATSGQTIWNKTIGYSWPGASMPGPSVLFPCPMIGNARLFILSNKMPYQALPDLVALSPTDGRELWRHSVPCEQDPLNSTACRPALWNHQALSDSILFMAAGFLYGIDIASGRTTWTYGFTPDNWNPLAYVGGVLYALNTPNGLSPSLSAFAIEVSPVAEMPAGAPVWILGVVLLCAQIVIVRNRSSDKKRKTIRAQHLFARHRTAPKHCGREKHMCEKMCAIGGSYACPS